jgi:SAM-dependent methyltransferase
MVNAMTGIPRENTDPIESQKRRLNVGCGRNILDGWPNLDNADIPGIDIRFDLEACRNTPIPLQDNCIDELLLSHVIEHIHDSLALMQELYRVAKPGALCTIRVPFGSSDDAWEDPTHVRPYFPGSFGYFSQPYYWRADYGYRGDWQAETIHLRMSKEKYQSVRHEQLVELLERARNLVVEMIATLVAVKPSRQPLRELQVPAKISIVLV